MTTRSRLVSVVGAIVIGAGAAAVYSRKPAAVHPAPLVAATGSELTTPPSTRSTRWRASAPMRPR